MNDELNENSTEFNEEELNDETADNEELSETEEGEVLTDEEAEGLPFAKAEVVRLMKQNLDSDKMIRERVKVEMNKFLGEVLERVCEQLNEYPYTNEEKRRILMHLEAIKADCDALSMDVKKSLKLKDVDEEEDEF